MPIVPIGYRASPVAGSEDFSAKEGFTGREPGGLAPGEEC